MRIAPAALMAYCQVPVSGSGIHRGPRPRAEEPTGDTSLGLSSAGCAKCAKRRWRRLGLAISGCLVAALCAGPALAQEDEADDDPPLLLNLSAPEIHGFVSQGYIRSLSNNYLTATDSKRGSFEMTELGINFTQTLSERVRAGIQLFARDLGRIGDYSIKADWFYLEYRWADWLSVRAGRTKLPFGLYNEINDVDSARVPILLPQSTYPTRSRDYLLAQTGLELYGRVTRGALGALDYRVYTGTIFIELPPQADPNTRVLDLQVPYLYGARLLWETPIEGLRVGGAAQKLRLDAQAVQNATPLELKAPITMWLLSLEYAADPLTLAIEYSRWHARSTTSSPETLPPTSIINERGYVMAAWRVTDWFQPGAYYSIYFPDTKNRTGTAAQQHDTALTLRFDLQAHWLFKLEGHYMVGTADIDRSLNVTLAGPTALERNWAVFLAKTTAYF